MEITRSNLLSLINSGRQRLDLSVSALEKTAGVPKDTVRDFMRGKTQILRADKLQKILRILQPQPTVAISGYVGTGGEIFSPDKNVSEDDRVDCPPGLDPQDVVAVRVRGDFMLPVFQNNWVIYYSEKHDLVIPPLHGGWQVPYHSTKKPGENSGEEPLAAFMNKPCVMRLKSGRILLKTIKPGKKPGHYRLASYNAPDIADAELEWAARIIFIKTE